MKIGFACYFLYPAESICKVVVLFISQMRMWERGLREVEKQAQPTCLVEAKLETELRFFHSLRPHVSCCLSH